MCYSPRALGHGLIGRLRDIISVRPAHFDPARTSAIAHEIGLLNQRLMSANRPCVLIGPGRWGSSHSSLGIPVTWSQICAARVIVETTLAEFVIPPSSGSHFFQNLTSFGIADLAINRHSVQGFVDWGWLLGQPAVYESPHVRNVRLGAPLEARLSGLTSRAVVLKPPV